jgi:RND family efflux transporter MFP subunit
MSRKKWVVTVTGALALLTAVVAGLVITGKLPLSIRPSETAPNSEWSPDGTDTGETSGGEWIPDASDAQVATDAEEASRNETTAEESPTGSDTVSLEEGAPVDLSPELVQLLGVRTEALQKRALRKIIRAVGRFDYNERTLAVVTSRTAGRVERLFVNFVGESVRKGAPLLWMYSPELVSAQREHLIALRSDKRTQHLAAASILNGFDATETSLANATRQRLELRGLTDAQIAEVETKGVSTFLHVRAPIGGTVIQKNVLEGAYVGEGTPLFTIADLSSVWLYADVYESDIGWVQVGQEIRVFVPAYPGQIFTGKIAFVDPIVDPRTRTTRVRAEFANGGSKLKPGMFAQSEIRRSMGNVLAIPESAVIFSGKRNIVVKSLGNGRYQPKEVVVGPLAEGYYPALRGVSEGEVVVTSANFLIDSESNLRSAIRKLDGSGDSEPTPATDGGVMPDRRTH